MSTQSAKWKLICLDDDGRGLAKYVPAYQTLKEYNTEEAFNRPGDHPTPDH